MTFHATLRPLARALAAAFCRGTWACAAGVLACGSAFAGAVTDGTVGPVRTFSGQFTVPASVGTVRGSNLFHSFGRFGVEAGGSATFQSPDAALRHVIVRVTGAEPSVIDGPVRLTAPEGARPGLWFMNPNGIVIGAEGTFDVPGSLALSTAQNLVFADGSRWSASATPGGTLTVAEPRSFGFLAGEPAGAVAFLGASVRLPLDSQLRLEAGDLFVGPGSTLTANQVILSAQRNVTLSESTVTARSDRFNPTVPAFLVTGQTIDVQGAELRQIASTSTPKGAGGLRLVAQDSLTLDGESKVQIDNSSPNVVEGIQLLGGGITVRGGAIVAAVGSSAGPSPDLLIRATADLVLESGASVKTTANGVGTTGRIELVGQNVRVEGTADAPTKVEATPSFRSTGSAGTVRIDAKEKFELLGDASVSTVSFGLSSPAAIEVDAQNVVADGRGASALLSSEGLGSPDRPDSPGGRVDVRASGSIQLLDGAGVVVSGNGNGALGLIRVNAPIIVMDGRGGGPRGGVTGLDGAAPTDPDDPEAADSRVVGADVLVSGRDLTMRGGAMIFTATGSSAPAGRITVTVDRLTLMDAETGILASTIGTGPAGTITLEARELTMSGGAGVRSDTGGSAKAGDILIDAQRVQLRGAGTAVSSNTEGSGIGGLVRIAATEVQLQDGAVVSTSTLATGQAGAVLIAAQQLTLQDRASISASTVGEGDGGLIAVRASSLALGRDAAIVSNASGPGAGGVIEVKVDGPLTLRDGGLIQASTDGPGPGGLIDVEARSLSLEGKGSLPGRFSAIVSEALEKSSGQPGLITVKVTGPLVMREGAAVSTANAGSLPRGAIADASGVVLEAASILMEGAGIQASAFGRADAGEIRVTSGGSISLRQGSLIATAAVDGNGGPLSVQAEGLLSLRDSQVTTSVSGRTNGNGGDIRISAPTIVMRSGFVQANTEAPRARGGDVFITPQLLLPDGSNLRAGGDRVEAFVAGVAGYNIIQAAAPDGVKGELNVSRPALNVAGALVALSTPRIGLGRLTSDFCEVATDNSLSVMTRGALYPWFSAPLSWTSRPPPEAAATPSPPRTTP